MTQVAMTAVDDHDCERAFGDAVHQEPQSDAAEHEAGHVEAAGVDGVDLLQDERAEDDRHDADRAR